jgi:hypothetical protein
MCALLCILRLLEPPRVCVGQMLWLSRLSLGARLSGGGRGSRFEMKIPITHNIIIFCCHTNLSQLRGITPCFRPLYVSCLLSCICIYLSHSASSCVLQIQISPPPPSLFEFSSRSPIPQYDCCKEFCFQVSFRQGLSNYYGKRHPEHQGWTSL